MRASRRLRWHGGFILLAAVAVASIGWARRATADEETSPSASSVVTQMQSMSQQLESLRGELSVARLQLDRAEAVMEYSQHYSIPADLASAVYDIALAEGIEPGLAFRLVSVESRFDLRAKSPVGAFGLTQLMPSTARLYEAGVGPAQLYDRDTNLRLGFRYLHDLLAHYDDNLERALLAYNRGPGKVQELLDAGMNPGNGYAQSVMRGYHRRVSTAE